MSDPLCDLPNTINLPMYLYSLCLFLTPFHNLHVYQIRVILLELLMILFALEVEVLRETQLVKGLREIGVDCLLSLFRRVEGAETQVVSRDAVSVESLGEGRDKLLEAPSL